MYIYLYMVIVMIMRVGDDNNSVVYDDVDVWGKLTPGFT